MWLPPTPNALCLQKDACARTRLAPSITTLGRALDDADAYRCARTGIPRNFCTIGAGAGGFVQACGMMHMIHIEERYNADAESMCLAEKSRQIRTDQTDLKSNTQIVPPT